jgi:hypothetical protein
MVRGFRASITALCAGLALFVLIAFSNRPSVLFAQALQLQLVPQDTSLSLDSRNYSGQPVLTTYTGPDSTPASAVLMTFDVSDLPVGAQVQQATLQLALVQSDTAADSTYTITAHKVVGKNPIVAAATGQTTDGAAGWTPNGCCANDIPLAQGDISAPYDTQAIDSTPGYKSWTITAMLQEWVADPTTNFGLVLNPDASKPRDRFRSFASAEHADPRLRPVLRITYSSPSGDVTPPSVQLTAPASGATVARGIALSATASDDMAVAGVQFQLDGTPIGPEVAALPYVLDWDTTAASDGAHTLTATARDEAGNTAASAGVPVNIVNGVLRLAPDDTSLSLDAVNYSRHQLLSAYTWPDNRIARAILLKFDLQAVPRGAVVQEAKLKLALVESDAAQEPTYTVTAHKVSGKNPAIVTATGYKADTATEWTPTICCENNAPMAQADISAPSDTQVIDKAPGFKSWTITALAQEWLADPATNFGILLNPDKSKPRDRYRFFASVEHPDPNLRPFLELTYIPPSATASPLAVSDLIGPTVSVTAPAAGATVSGTVNVSADATDILGVAGVQFELDGVSLGAEDTAAPYSVSWNTSISTNGSHALTAVARNTMGLVSRSAAVSVTVANDITPPVLSAVTASAITSSGATIRWTTNEPSTSRVNYGITAAYDQSSELDASLVTAHTVTLGGLAAGTLYHYRVRSRDAAGNPAISGDFTFTTLTAADVTPPTVSLSAPAAGANVSGTIAVSATASDNVGVAAVQFRLDGAALGAEDTANPYAMSWETTTASNGSHTLTAVARDAAGNSTTSAGVSVTVSNGSIVLTPQDTSLNLNTTNYSSDPMLMTYTWPDNQPANAILMKFDLSSVPAGAVVEQATLQLALMQADTAADAMYTVSAHRVVNKNPVIASATGLTADGVTPWTANACCSNNVPLAQADISAPYDAQAIDKATGVKSWTITRMVQEWLSDPAANLGLLLNSDPSRLRDRYRFFASAEHPDTSLRPSLRVTYTLVPDTTPPVMSAVTSSAITASGATISWTTDEASDSQVEYGTTTAYGSLTTLDTNRVTAHAVTLSGLAANTLYHFRVRSRDSAGNLGMSSDATLTTPGTDLTPPAVSITAPGAGTTVSGTVSVSASASDNVGVVGVQFKVDGVNFGTEDTTAPYARAWDTTAATNGTHSISAVARDAAGNQKLSVGVTVTVNNSSPLWPNEPVGFVPMSNQPWNQLTGNGWGYLRRTASKDATIVADASAPLSPSSVLRMVFTTDMQRDSEPSVHWIGLPRPTEVYSGWWMKVSPNWSCSPAGCGKITFLFPDGANGAGVTYSNLADNGDGSHYVNIATTWPSTGYRFWQPNVTKTVVAKNEWFRVEWYVKWASSPGATDGSIRWWVNGVLNGDYRTLPFPAIAGFIEYQHAATMQNVPPAEQYMYIDHTYVSRR